MRILAFETSAKAASAALLEDGRLVAESYQNSGLTHSRTLMKMAEDLLQNCGIPASGIDAAAVAAGPGSFTGVRIGVSAAKGFAWGRQIPCRGVSSLEAMAWSAAPREALIVPAMDARRSQVYCAAFYRTVDGVCRVLEDAAISIEELGEQLAATPGEKILVGDGAELCYNTLRDKLPRLRLSAEHLRFQRASGVALGAWNALRRGEPAGPETLVPTYLRMSQAERERKKREELSKHG
ncbi:MAG: tRNA (adenosine(37)-N6)-threonylcarbamoyltransferase complex dimerization subunit type 1 TsaB [Oscillospiraceae bacterium]|nr:tRNA (adenosine(37)-N6)-threonylcarbamoyltransferase complex dimerization subunit type 1 TsaB [Oscillospiraceae bacterium]